MTDSDEDHMTDSDITTVLDEIRERYAARPGDVECLLAAVDAVLALHRPVA